MPQDPVTVYSKETGDPFAMHSVDAQEALRLGDYVATPPEDVDPQQRAEALARMRSTGATVHPELQTPEEREETRRQANERAEMDAASGRPVVVSPQQVGVQPSEQSSQPRGARGRFGSTPSAEQQAQQTQQQAAQQAAQQAEEQRHLAEQQAEQQRHQAEQTRRTTPPTSR